MRGHLNFMHMGKPRQFGRLNDKKLMKFHSVMHQKGIAIHQHSPGDFSVASKLEKSEGFGNFVRMSRPLMMSHLKTHHGISQRVFHNNEDLVRIHAQAGRVGKVSIPHVHTAQLLEKSDNRFAGMTKAEIQKAIVSKGPVDLILRHGRKKAGLGIGNICPHCGGLLGGKADPTLHTYEQCEVVKNSRGNILDHLEVFHNKRGLRGKGLRGLVVFHRVLHEHGSLNHDVTSRAITRPKEVVKAIPGDLESHIRIQHGVDPGAGKNLVAMHDRLHKIGKVLHPHGHPGLFRLGKSDISKRDFDPGVGKHGTDRDKLDASDFAMPGERLYPIMCQQDVTDALRLSGKHPGVRPAIIALAKRKGFSVPDDSEVKKCVITKSAYFFQTGVKISKGLSVNFSHMDDARKKTHLSRAHGISVDKEASDLSLARTHNSSHKSGKLLKSTHEHL
jgi:hypothetical protein